MLHSRVLHWSASGCFAGDSLLGHSSNNGFLLLSNNAYVECLVHKNSLNSWTKTKFTSLQLEPYFFLDYFTYSQNVWMVHKPEWVLDILDILCVRKNSDITIQWLDISELRGIINSISQYPEYLTHIGKKMTETKKKTWFMDAPIFYPHILWTGIDMLWSEFVTQA